MKKEKNKEIILNDQPVVYCLKTSLRAKNLKITIRAGGAVAAVKPRFISEKFVEDFLLKKADWVLEKIEELKKDAKRLGTTIIETRHADLTKSLPESLKETFDHVLVDAPCTGIGTLRRNPEIKWRTTATNLTAFARTQNTVLQNASLAVRRGGHLIYCTCSLLPQENENVIGNFLKLNHHFSICPLPESIPPQLIDPNGYFRTYPHLHNMDGFFAAIFKRN
jgi:16S rRNA (cytosine967-C5)-methyltransferase